MKVRQLSDARQPVVDYLDTITPKTVHADRDITIVPIAKQRDRSNPRIP